jgi:hypothetical protein
MPELPNRVAALRDWAFAPEGRVDSSWMLTRGEARLVFESLTAPAAAKPAWKLLPRVEGEKPEPGDIGHLAPGWRWCAAHDHAVFEREPQKGDDLPPGWEWSHTMGRPVYVGEKWPDPMLDPEIGLDEQSQTARDYVGAEDAEPPTEETDTHRAAAWYDDAPPRGTYAWYEWLNDRMDDIHARLQLLAERTSEVTLEDEERTKTPVLTEEGKTALREAIEQTPLILPTRTTIGEGDLVRDPVSGKAFRLVPLDEPDEKEPTNAELRHEWLHAVDLYDLHAPHGDHAYLRASDRMREIGNQLRDRLPDE